MKSLELLPVCVALWCGIWFLHLALAQAQVLLCNLAQYTPILILEQFESVSSMSVYTPFLIDKGSNE
jgi:hypothetical protein